MRLATEAKRIVLSFRGDQDERIVPSRPDAPSDYPEKLIEQAQGALFENTVEFLTTPGHPPTCMSLAGAVGCSVNATPAKQLMTEIRKQNEAAIKSCLVRARKSGELPKEINVDDYTRYLSRVLAGLSIQAANGSTKAEHKQTKSANYNRKRVEQSQT